MSLFHPSMSLPILVFALAAPLPACRSEEPPPKVDYRAQASQEITPENAAAELDRLEAEMQAETP